LRDAAAGAVWAIGATEALAATPPASPQGGRPVRAAGPVQRPQAAAAGARDRQREIAPSRLSPISRISGSPRK